MESSYDRIPPHIKQAIDKHVEEARPCGHFVTAVLENDLNAAFAHADTSSLEALNDIVKYVYNHIPSQAWGSPAKVRAWRRSVKQGGIDYEGALAEELLRDAMEDGFLGSFFKKFFRA